MPTTIRAALTEAERALAGAGVADAGRESCWLLAHVLGTTAGNLRLRMADVLSQADAVKFDEFVRRRADREPLQYILGTEEFMGMTFHVTPVVLIPRFDTETVVRAAASLLQGTVRVADVGTGSGAIAVGFASLLPAASVIATDISPEALAVARLNAEANGVLSRVEFRLGDLLAPLGSERLDAVLSNPPYISENEFAGLMPEVRDWEPRQALTPGDDGLVMYRRLALGAGACLKPGGILAVEVGAGQAEPVRALFEGAGFVAVSTVPDTAGIQRVVVGRTPAS